jgi:hypothetical protein
VATSLVEELQLDAANAAVSASSLLRKTLIVAAKLEVSNVPEWIDKELSGYRDGDVLPSYRIIDGSVTAKGFGGWIPVQFPTNDLEETVSRTYIRESVAQVEALREREGMLGLSFPDEAQRMLQELFRHNVQFSCVIDKAKLDAIIDEIRNRVLRWAIALDRAGIRGDALHFTNTEKEKAHNVVFHVDTGNVNVGVVGDVGGHANVAASLCPSADGIDVDDIRTLVEAITAHVGALSLSAPYQNELKGALRQLTTADSGKASKTTTIVRQTLNRVLAILGKAGESVITLGIKALVENWMKQRGMVP